MSSSNNHHSNSMNKHEERGPHVMCMLSEKTLYTCLHGLYMGARAMSLVSEGEGEKDPYISKELIPEYAEAIRELLVMAATKKEGPTLVLQSAAKRFYETVAEELAAGGQQEDALELFEKVEPGSLLG
jgi:hypothetical protein